MFTWDKWRGSYKDQPTLFIKTLASWRGWSLDLHKFVFGDEEGCYHTHPATAFRFVLWGGYVEEMEDGSRRTWRPGRIGRVEPELSHRIVSLLNGRSSYSLWLRGPRRAEIELRGPGWDHDQFEA